MMKTIDAKIKFLTLLVLLGLFVVSCKKNTTKKLEKNITEGNWKVTLFNEDGDDETYYFSGYNFTFSDNGTVSASSGSNSVSGTWSSSDDNSSDDSPSDLHFNLNFPEVNNFDELNDDWHIISQSSSKLELKDVSGGNGGTDLLTFEKN